MCRLGQWFGPSSTVSGLNVCSVTLFPYIGLHLIPLGYIGAQKVERPEPNSEPLIHTCMSVLRCIFHYAGECAQK